MNKRLLLFRAEFIRQEDSPVISPFMGLRFSSSGDCLILKHHVGTTKCFTNSAHQCFRQLLANDSNQRPSSNPSTCQLGNPIWHHPISTQIPNTSTWETQGHSVISETILSPLLVLHPQFTDVFDNGQVIPIRSHISVENAKVVISCNEGLEHGLKNGVVNSASRKVANECDADWRVDTRDRDVGGEREEVQGTGTTEGGTAKINTLNQIYWSYMPYVAKSTLNDTQSEKPTGT
ncbi:hypothetical protein ARMGADRAFT_1034941 [Armillaria gallica]|uniref:Uncharacterized protein n=1 Tax=Armillaria gallica TaxID=47427 RepID=A0A2H3DE63_ARMGA|nr:hypothetical protein ARMGADRAFT_1034941 [Armillaria gallica]